MLLKALLKPKLFALQSMANTEIDLESGPELVWADLSVHSHPKPIFLFISEFSAITYNEGFYFCLHLVLQHLENFDMLLEHAVVLKIMYRTASFYRYARIYGDMLLSCSAAFADPLNGIKSY